MIDFPASPTLNQTHTAAGRSWRWNGTVWQGISSSGGGGVTSYNDLTDKPTLATVATSGSYTDLANKPTLGTAAATNATDYATAAQGANAISKNTSDYTPVNSIRAITQAEYDAIATKDGNTIYFIKQ
jgi:hypothetical protein